MCASQVLLINKNERCPFCFSSEFNWEIEKCCQECFKRPLLLDGVAAAFDYEGPQATLIKELKYGKKSYLAKSLGAFLFTQLITLDWPIPDLIIPMPSTRLKQLERGFNQSYLIADSLAQLLNGQVTDILKRKSVDFSQAGLNLNQRLKLKSSSFGLKKITSDLSHKSILLIDDVMTTGSSLKCCREALHPLLPKSIHALTVCRAI